MNLSVNVCAIIKKNRVRKRWKMKAKVFIGDKYLTKVNINKTEDIPKLNDLFQMDKAVYYVREVEISYMKPYFSHQVLK